MEPKLSTDTRQIAIELNNKYETLTNYRPFTLDDIGNFATSSCTSFCNYNTTASYIMTGGSQCSATSVTSITYTNADTQVICTFNTETGLLEPIEDTYYYRENSEK